MLKSILKTIHKISNYLSITFFPAFAIIGFNEYFSESKSSDYLLFSIALTIASLSGIYTLFIDFFNNND